MKRTREEQQSTKLWTKTIRKLALLRGLTGEAAVSIVDRLVDIELARIEKERAELARLQRERGITPPA